MSNDAAIPRNIYICKTISPVDGIVIKTPYQIIVRKKLDEICSKYPLLPLSDCLRIAALELNITEDEIKKIL